MRADPRPERRECEEQGRGSVTDLERVTTLGTFLFLDGPQFSHLQNANLETFFFPSPMPRIPPNHTRGLEKSYKAVGRD